MTYVLAATHWHVIHHRTHTCHSPPLLSKSSDVRPLVTGVVGTAVSDNMDRDDDGEPETYPEGESTDDTRSQDSRSTANSGGSSPPRACTSGPESEVGDFLGPESDDSAYEVL